MPKYDSLRKTDRDNDIRKYADENPEILKEALDKSRSKKLTWLAQSQPKDGSR